jgi:hypothetical protein
LIVNIHDDLISYMANMERGILFLSAVVYGLSVCCLFSVQFQSLHKSIHRCKSPERDICQTVCLNKLTYVNDRLLNIHFRVFFPPMNQKDSDEILFRGGNTSFSHRERKYCILNTV